MNGINEQIDSMEDSIIKSIQELVGIESIRGKAKDGMPYGEEVNRALEYTLSLAKSMGFRTVNVDGYMGYAEYGQGDEMVGVLGHLDVVPAGSGWDYPPFEGQVHEGRIYGRGTIDNKGPIIAALYGLKAIKDGNLPIKRRVRILFGTDEENDCKEVEYYLKRDEAPVLGFTPDAEYPIIYAEKGILVFKVVKDFNKSPERDINIRYIKGGNAPNMVPDHCEAALIVKKEDVKNKLVDSLNDFIKSSSFNISFEDRGSEIVIISEGISAHGSVPHMGRNAIMPVLIFLKELDIKGQDKEFINFFADNIGMELKGESLGLYMRDDTGELSFNLGGFSLDEEGASASLNIRYPVTFKTSDVMDVFNEKIKDLGVRIEDMVEQAPLYFPKDHVLIETLKKVYKEQTGLEPELLAIGGGTYAKEMPNTVAFGPVFPGKPDLAHQANEYIDIKELILNAKIYANAIYELAK